MFYRQTNYFTGKNTNKMEEQEKMSTSLSETDKLTEYMGDFMDWAVAFAPKLGLAIFILVVGFWLVKKMSKIFGFTLEKAQMAPEVITFLSSLVNVVLKVAVLLVAAGIIGFEMTSLVGIIAAVGFAIGMALQGSLGNFAAGIMIMVFKPYKVGEWVEISEKFGRVESIHIFNTAIGTPGNKTHIIPNGQVVEGVITNFSSKGHIRIELTIMMPYEESFPKVKQVILEALAEIPEVMKDPPSLVGIESYDSHNIILAVRPFIKPDDYWEVTFEVNRKIKEAFYKAGIKMAYSEGVELGPIGA
ncbi:MAG: small conductance mechanosensitive channel [Saprospiraceae bacterium]